MPTEGNTRGIFLTSLTIICILFLGTFKAFWVIFKLHISAYADLLKIWTPFIAVVLCAIMLRAIRWPIRHFAEAQSSPKMSYYTLV